MLAIVTLHVPFVHSVVLVLLLGFLVVFVIGRVLVRIWDLIGV